MQYQQQRKKNSTSFVQQILNLFFRTKASKTGTIIIVGFVVLMVVGPFLTPYSAYQRSSSKNSAPSLSHPLGTNYLGEDVLSQVIFGSYVSMFVAVLAAAGSVTIGLVVGVFSGYFRRVESLLSGTGDVILTFPPLPLMILLGELYPATTTLITIILIVVLWPVVARAIRSQVLSLKERPYVETARTSGMSDLQIIRRIMVPEVAPLAIAYFVLTVSAAVVLVTALQFLGVGNPDEVSWGSMLYWAQQFAFYSGDWWWILAPGISITLIALAFALLGFSVEEVMNPRLKT
jgi:ABC-type dipeptide/oligopeptide/nickel transport system permease subunit